jgi:outer membrane protein OmpA-like peptidoglycan-associated protein
MAILSQFIHVYGKRRRPEFFEYSQAKRLLGDGMPTTSARTRLSLKLSPFIALLTIGTLVGLAPLPAQATSQAAPFDSTCLNIIDHFVSSSLTDHILIQSTGCTGAVVIPSGVTKILSAFNDDVNITSVFIPKTVTEIDQYAFAGTTGLLSFTVEEGSPFWTEKEGGLFYAPSSVRNTLIAFPAALNQPYELPWYVTNIGANAFERSNIPSLVVDSGLVEIEGTAFVDPKKLKQITFLGNMPKLGSSLITTRENVQIYASIESNFTTPRYEGMKVRLAPSVGCLDDVHLSGGYLQIAGTVLVSNHNCGGTVSIPPTITEIAAEAFRSSVDLKKIKFIGDSHLASIGRAAFYNAVSLDAIELPESLMLIGDLAFGGTTALNSISIPDGVSNIGEGTFSKSGIESIGLPSTINYIGYEAFSHDSNLVSIEIPSGTQTISVTAFKNCSKLTNINFMSQPSLLVSGDAYYPHSAEKLVLSDDSNPDPSENPSPDLKAYVSERFNTSPARWGGIPLVKSLSIASSTVGALAVAGDVITSGAGAEGTVEIPENIKKMNLSDLDSASITAFVVDPLNRFFKSIDGVIYSKDGKTLVKYPSGRLDGDHGLAIPEGVEVIGEFAFKGAQLRWVTLPSTLKTIQQMAFYQQRSGFGLESISFPSSLRTIGTRAFELNDSLASITFEPNSELETVGINAFVGSSSPNIQVPASVVTIFPGAFSQMASLSNLRFENSTLRPSQLTYIGHEAFSDDPALADVALPDSVVSICDRAFVGDPLSALIFGPDSLLERIGIEAFAGMPGFGDITLPARVNSIGAGAFGDMGENPRKRVTFLGNEPDFVDETAFGLGSDEGTLTISNSATGFHVDVEIPKWRNLTVVRTGEASVAISPSTTAPPTSVPEAPVSAPVPTSPTPSPSPHPTSDGGTPYPTPTSEPTGIKLVTKLQAVSGMTSQGVPVLLGVAKVGPILFEGDSSKLDAKSMNAIRLLAANLPQGRGQFVVTGFVSARSSNLAVLRLATARAKVVAQMLSKSGIRSQIKYYGYGPLNIKSPSSKDRRVEIRWVAIK